MPLWSSFVSFFFLNNLFALPIYIHGCRASTGHNPKENWLFFLQKSSNINSSLARDGTPPHCPHPIHVGVLTSLVLCKPCALTGCYAFVMSRVHYCPLVFSILGLTVFPSSPSLVSEFWGGAVCDIQVPLVAENSTAIQPVVSFCFNYNLSHQESPRLHQSAHRLS